MIKTIRRLFLSVVIIYFLVMILVLANGSSVMGKALYPYFGLVANSMGLNTSWNFFSPDPAHVIYIKSLIIYQDEYGNTVKDTITDVYPPSEDKGDFGLVSRRDSFASRFFMIDAQRIQSYYAPWLCKKYPGARRVAIEGMMLSVPSLERAATELSLSVQEMMEEILVHQVNHTCGDNE